MKRLAALAVALGLALPAARVRAQDDALDRAMRDELARSMRELRLDTLPAPYFVAYRVEERSMLATAATRGSLVQSAEGRSRVLSVEVRVGDYALDNSNYGAGGMPGGMNFLTLDDDYGAIRRQLWLATDAAYKAAVEAFARKKAALEDATRQDSLPDFNREEATRTADTTPAARMPDRLAAESLVLRLSALLKAAPSLQRSRVSLMAGTVRTRYRNSEGTAFVRVSPTVALMVTASTQAADGAPLSDGFQAYARSWSDLPPADSLAARTAALGARLTALRDAPAAQTYNGPMLFEGEAAARLFALFFTPRLAAMRRPIVDNPAMQRTASRENVDEIGSRVLPRSFSVTADPTLDSYEGHATAGFRVDDEGVPSRRTALVDHGILRTLLATRTPVRGIFRSTGNRRGMVLAPGTLLVGADSGVDAAALRRQLLDLAAARGLQYGIVVRRFGGGGGLVADAVRLFPDGREEPVRGGIPENLTFQTFKDIVAASAAPAAFTLGDVSPVPTTFIVPSLLFEDVSLREPRGETPKLPVLSPPWAP